MSRSKRNAKADEYFRRAPNYSAEAIESLRLGMGLNSPDLEALILTLTGILESAHKFVLPDNGELFGPEIQPYMVGGARLPFPEVVIEYACKPNPNDRAPTPDEIRVTKRILVCAEQTFAGFGTGIAAYSILFHNGEWNPSSIGIFTEYVDRDQEPTIRIISKGSLASDFLARYPDRREAETVAIRNSFLEMRALFQLLAALSCTNVTTELIRPNREARAARPESTLFDYHVLMIRPGAERHEGNPLGGSHASPRTHLRRGHIRQHQTAGRIWVNSCVVNPTAIGTVNKDYRIVV